MVKYIPGVSVAVLIALISMFLANLEFVQKTLHFSSLILAILLGVVIGNLVKFPESFKPGITFSLKKILRIAIIFLGFRLTFQNVMEVGLVGLIVDTIMLSSTFILGGLDSKKMVWFR